MYGMYDIAIGRRLELDSISAVSTWKVRSIDRRTADQKPKENSIVGRAMSTLTSDGNETMTNLNKASLEVLKMFLSENLSARITDARLRGGCVTTISQSRTMPTFKFHLDFSFFVDLQVLTVPFGRHACCA
jgi:hypothetical protein